MSNPVQIKTATEENIKDELEEFKYNLKRLRKISIVDGERKVSPEELNKVIDIVDTWLSRY